MSPETLADANLIQAIREHARWQAHCELIEENGILLLAGPNALPVGYRNCAARIDPSVPAKDVLARAQAFFARYQRGFAVLTRDSVDADLEALLQQAGAKGHSSPCMLIEQPLPEAPLPPGIRVERFTSERQVLDAVSINAEAYQAIKLPAVETRLYFNRPSALLAENITGFVLYEGDQPLSTAMTVHTGASAGVYWVGTVAAGQRRGLASICTQLATNAGFEKGASLVTLQASKFGEPVYLKLGYRIYDRMKWYGVAGANVR